MVVGAIQLGAMNHSINQVGAMYHNQTLSGLYPIKKGVINSYPTHKRLITNSYPNCIHICYQGGADSLIQLFSARFTAK